MIETVIDMRPATATELTTIERAELGRYEAVIKRGLDTFFEVGNALAKIRDGKLYRGEYSTFDEYCRGRWDFTDRRARMLIDAAGVVENLATGTIVPVNEAQARPLTKLEPDQQREAWAEAVESAPNGKVTAAHVEKAVAKFAAPKSPQTKPEPVQYAAAWELEGKVADWLADNNAGGAHANYSPAKDAKPIGADYVLSCLVADTSRNPSQWLGELSEWLIGRGVNFRKRDLLAAINNVREQRRVAERQAQARKVYTEPTPKPEPELMVVNQTPPDLASAGYSIVPLPDGLRYRWVKADGETGDTWSWADAVADARKRIELTPPDEAEAIAIVEAETAQEDAERAARDAQRPIYERVVPVTERDLLDRRKRAELLRYMLVQARDAARRDYGDLTGRHTDMLEFERGVADMLPPLESLITILEGTK